MSVKDSFITWLKDNNTYIDECIENLENVPAQFDDTLLATCNFFDLDDVNDYRVALQLLFRSDKFYSMLVKEGSTLSDSYLLYYKFLCESESKESKKRNAGKYDDYERSLSKKISFFCKIPNWNEYDSCIIIDYYYRFVNKELTKEDACKKVEDILQQFGENSGVALKHTIARCKVANESSFSLMSGIVKKNYQGKESPELTKALKLYAENREEFNKKLSKAYELGESGDMYPDLVKKAHNTVIDLNYNEPFDLSVLDSDVKWWMYAPGANASKFEEFKKEGIIAIGWDYLDDLTTYSSRDSIVEAMQRENNDFSKSYSNDSLCNWQFVHDMKLGDIIIVKDGVYNMIGVARVKSGYRYDRSRKDYYHVRDVEWLAAGSWSFPRRLSMKTLTDISSYNIMRANIKIILKKGVLCESIDTDDFPSGDISDSGNTDTSQNVEKQYTGNGDEDVMNYPKNLILYGPPGTGKTYNTVLYAVAIIEGKALDDVKNEALKDYESVKDRYNLYVSREQIKFTTFHQSYGYEEFIEGIKPICPSDSVDQIEDIRCYDDLEKTSESIQFHVKPGIFKGFCESVPKKNNVSFDDAWGKLIDDIKTVPGDNKYIFTRHTGSKITLELIDDETFRAVWSTGAFNSLKKENIKEQYENPSIFENRSKLSGGTKWAVVANQAIITELKNKYAMTSGNTEKDGRYVFVIDEINRGNISKIFGELITLIEDSKRNGADEAMSIILPYSNESFSVPNNVYIIGTMNTADRSIALMDTALRRRFEFVEMMPDPTVIKDEKSGKPVIINNIDIQKMLKAINARIEYFYDREHTIGHAYFTKLLKDKNQNINVLAEIFKNKVIPLLQEYFYGDYEKIYYVLGDNAKDKKYRFVDIKEVDLEECFVGSVVGEKLFTRGKDQKQYVLNDKDDVFTHPESYIGIYE